jgi:hypothetical protein
MSKLNPNDHFPGTFVHKPDLTPEQLNARGQDPGPSDPQVDQVPSTPAEEVEAEAAVLEHLTCMAHAMTPPGETDRKSVV